MLSGQQIGQVQEALLSGFRSHDELAMMVQLELNKNLNAIAGGENLSVVVFKLVMWAESEGRTHDLIEGAQARKGGNPEIQQLARAAASWSESTQALSTPATPSATPALAPRPSVIDIFLSYSRAETAMMRRLQNDLRAAGFTVWIDEGLAPGTPSWQAAIQEAIEQAGCLVVLLTPSAKASVWVNREVKLCKPFWVSRLYPLLWEGDDAAQRCPSA